MSESKPDLYRDLAAQLKALLAGETDRVANAANMAALIYHGLSDLNWAGFYFRQGQELVLGPFQGKPAYGSRSAREFVAPQHHGPQRFWSATSTISRVISLATRLPAQSLSYH
jgi:hypothetical protein